MALDFPASPTLNQTYAFGTRVWKWNGEGWELVPQAYPLAGTDAQVIFNNENVAAGATNFVYDATNQRVGIGTTVPQYKLDVDGDINFTGIFYQNSSPFVASRWTSGTGDNIYRLNGNVGIGTTNPTSKLTVTGDVTISGITTSGLLNVGVGGTIITTTGIGSVGIGSTLPGSTLVVNAPSGYTGNLLDIQLGAATQYRFGNQAVNGGWAPLSVAGNNGFIIQSGGTTVCSFSSGTGLQITAGGLSFSSGFANNIGDVQLFRDSADVLAQRRGTNAQTFRIYNTYTSASQYERAYLGWNNNDFIVGTEKGSSIGTARNLYLQTDGTTAVAISTTQNVGIGTTNPRFKLEVGAVGASGTSLLVNGDARVTGILTVGTSSIVLDGNTDNLRVGAAVTINSSGASVVGVITASTFSGTLIGGASVTINSQTSAYILASSDFGKLISITTGGVTVPQNTFSAGQSILIYNNSASSQTITQGLGVTLRLPGTSDTGNRTLQQRGLASIFCVASNEFLITGTGLL